MPSNDLSLQVGTLLVTNTDPKLSGEEYVASFKLESSNGLTTNVELNVQLLSEDQTNAKAAAKLLKDQFAAGLLGKNSETNQHSSK